MLPGEVLHLLPTHVSTGGLDTGTDTLVQAGQELLVPPHVDKEVGAGVDDDHHVGQDWQDVHGAAVVEGLFEILPLEAHDALDNVETGLESMAGDTGDDNCEQHIGGRHIPLLTTTK